MEKIVLVFQCLDKLRDLADGKWYAGVEAEAAAKAGDQLRRPCPCSGRNPIRSSSR